MTTHGRGRTHSKISLTLPRVESIVVDVVVGLVLPDKLHFHLHCLNFEFNYILFRVLAFHTAFPSRSTGETTGARIVIDGLN